MLPLPQTTTTTAVVSASASVSVSVYCCNCIGTFDEDGGSKIWTPRTSFDLEHGIVLASFEVEEERIVGNVEKHGLDQVK